MSDGNPKLVGSNLIDAVPQTGKCPNGCEECFYNRAFYRPLDTPLLPSDEEAAGKIVRVNSGHDSNLDYARVVVGTSHYPHKFYNTSMPRFDFPAPVVFTCNGREPLFVACPPNVMFVRVRTNTWDVDVQDRLVAHYLDQGAPVVLTFMRYYTRRPDNTADYDWGRHIQNPCWRPTHDAQMRVLARYKGTGVRVCCPLDTLLCVDCRNCEFLYWECMRRLGHAAD